MQNLTVHVILSVLITKLPVLSFIWQCLRSCKLTESCENICCQSIKQYRKCLPRDVVSTVQIITVHKIHNSIWVFAPAGSHFQSGFSTFLSPTFGIWRRIITGAMWVRQRISAQCVHDAVSCSMWCLAALLTGFSVNAHAVKWFSRNDDECRSGECWHDMQKHCRHTAQVQETDCLLGQGSSVQHWRFAHRLTNTKVTLSVHSHRLRHWTRDAVSFATSFVTFYVIVLVTLIIIIHNHITRNSWSK